MRPRCFAHALVTGIAIAAWVIAVALMCAPPGPNDSMRLPFFAFLGVAVSASSLAAFPWVMRGFIKDVVLAYVAGRFDERAAMEDERPALTVVR